ncbi:hypothetical protein [Bacillus sp. REN3]|uniref:hypothetical protein n=1 Tax=Bacillus sp. REN3 TaxID=2802440 RepID=UPI001AED785E|nr:hypothetical protein [Bacillus sp. REN3]
MFSINKENRPQILLALSIIILLTSLFLPIICVFILQDIFYHSKSHWIFSTPASAYITFMIGMIWISVVLFFHIFMTSKYESSIIKWVSSFFILWSIPLFVLGVSNYYYVDERGIHYNYLGSINETAYEWNNFKEVKEIYSEKNGVSTIEEYEFITNDHEVIVLPFNLEFKEARKNILNILEENGVKVTNNYGELYELH